MADPTADTKPAVKPTAAAGAGPFNVSKPTEGWVDAVLCKLTTADAAKLNEAEKNTLAELAARRNAGNYSLVGTDLNVIRSVGERFGYASFK